MDNSTPNIKFCYLYRDAGNYKIYGEVIFANTDNLPLSEIESQIRAKLIDGEYFEPKKWGVPLLAFEDFDGELDHDWMEFEKVEETNDLVSVEKPIKDWLTDL